MQVQDKFTLALSTTLNKDNQDSSDFYDKVGPLCEVRCVTACMGFRFPPMRGNALRAHNFGMHCQCGECMQDLATKGGKGSLLDDYDYVMHGKVFKFKDNHKAGQLKVEVYVSYGGLLMQITGSPKELESMEVDSNVYLLMRKV